MRSRSSSSVSTTHLCIYCIILASLSESRRSRLLVQYYAIYCARTSVSSRTSPLSASASSQARAAYSSSHCALLLRCPRLALYTLYPSILVVSVVIALYWLPRSRPRPVIAATFIHTIRTPLRISLFTNIFCLNAVSFLSHKTLVTIAHRSRSLV